MEQKEKAVKIANIIKEALDKHQEKERESSKGREKIQEEARQYRKE